MTRRCPNDTHREKFNVNQDRFRSATFKWCCCLKETHDESGEERDCFKDTNKKMILTSRHFATFQG